MNKPQVQSLLIPRIEILGYFVEISKVAKATVERFFTKKSEMGSMGTWRRFFLKISVTFPKTLVWTPHFGSVRFPLDGELDFNLKN